MWDSFVFNIQMIEHLAKQVIPNIVVKEERGLPDGTHCSIDSNGITTLHWDSLMYDLFEKELTLIDSFPYNEKKDEKIISEMGYNYFAVLLDHIGEKYRSSPFISYILKAEANKYNYPYFAYFHEKLPAVSEWAVQYFIQTGVVKLLIMYHELAHCLFYLNKVEREKWENMVIANLTHFHEQKLDDFITSQNDNFHQEVHILLEKILTKNSDANKLLEELAADSYALSKTYATTHLNIHEVDKAFLSNNIMLGYLRYVSFSSRYGYISECWTDLYGMCITQKTKPEDKDNGEYFKREVAYSIRFYYWGFTSSINILLMDTNEWNYKPPHNISIDDPRWNLVLNIASYNSKQLEKFTNATLSPKFFNQIVRNTSILLTAKISEPFVYPTIPKDTLVLSWLSIQFYNCNGLEKIKRNDIRGALVDFRTAAALSQEVLGVNHRLTAREYNNICRCYLQLFIDYSSHLYEEHNLERIEFLELADRHSRIALDIIKQTNDTEDFQAGAIFQCAGEIQKNLQHYPEALNFFLQAKMIKEKQYEYSETNAITDTSIASTFLLLGYISEAEDYCNSALSFYQEHREDYKSEFYELKQMNTLIQQSLTSPTGKILNIHSTLCQGKTVELDQYQDFDRPPLG